MIVLPCEQPGFDSPWRSYQQISLPPRAARPTQPSILSRSITEYRIISGLTLGHRRCGLLPSTNTGGMTDGYVPTSPGRQVAPLSTELTEPRFRCAQLVQLIIDVDIRCKVWICVYTKIDGYKSVYLFQSKTGLWTDKNHKRNDQSLSPAENLDLLNQSYYLIFKRN